MLQFITCNISPPPLEKTSRASSKDGMRYGSQTISKSVVSVVYTVAYYTFTGGVDYYAKRHTNREELTNDSNIIANRTRKRASSTTSRKGRRLLQLSGEADCYQARRSRKGVHLRFRTHKRRPHNQGRRSCQRAESADANSQVEV